MHEPVCKQVLVFAKMWDIGDEYARACVQQVLEFCEGLVYWRIKYTRACVQQVLMFTKVCVFWR